ncbi:hypothetical protein LLEC1_00484 [Akanthomyces lecanii]|uniref:Uncharacterized protein n=1 Tax=Cordyceps confragosa TaxID=2714763 RepID=A0A179IE99_CORDF|nr:hypothetical protein LLEC1_00484 [Akanthomyces lecanii]
MINGSAKTPVLNDCELQHSCNTTAGNIKIDGLEISAVQRDELRGRITTITQEQLELAGSIRASLRPYDLDGNGTAHMSSSSLDSEPKSNQNNDDELQALLGSVARADSAAVPGARHAAAARDATGSRLVFVRS